MGIIIVNAERLREEIEDFDKEIQQEQYLSEQEQCLSEIYDLIEKELVTSMCEFEMKKDM